MEERSWWFESFKLKLILNLSSLSLLNELCDYFVRETLKLIHRFGNFLNRQSFGLKTEGEMFIPKGDRTGAGSATGLLR